MPETPETETPRVYLVDDDPAVLHSLSALLSLHGFQVQTFGAAGEFLTRADTASPGCLVTDLGMPGIDGKQLCQRLSDQASPLALVLLTGDVLLAAQLPVDAGLRLLVKPCAPAELVAAIEQALADSYRRVQAA